MYYKVIDPPDPNWLTRLQRWYTVYDPKNDQFMRVAQEWEPPKPGSCFGRIGVCSVWQDKAGWHVGSPVHSWYAKADGTGFDGSQILLPCSGHCPGEPISMVQFGQIETYLAELAEL